MTIEQAVAFFIFSLVAAITPGPSNTMILATGSAVGALRGLPCAFGAATGMGLLLFSSALGLGQIVLAQPILLKALNWAGAAFLLWLAWKIANAGPIAQRGSVRAAEFFEAAGFQLVNPKGWLVAVSAVGTYLRAGESRPLPQALAFGAVFFAAALPSGLVWLLLGAMLRRFLQKERTARAFNITMALALGASVVVMLL